MTVTQQTQTYSNTARWAVVAAFEKILTPLARLAIKHRIPFQAFATAAKRAFVRVANEEFAVQGRSQTKSRIAMLTGLTRTDVNSYLWDPQHRRLPDVDRGCRPSALVEGWRKDAFFQDENGDPLALPFRGKGRSFEILVQRYGADIPPKTMLEELINAGTVEETDDGLIKLSQLTYVPRGQGSTEQAQLMGMAGERFLNTAAHNVYRDAEQDEPPFFQQEFWTSGLPPHQVEAFRADLRSLLERHLAEARDYIESKEERPAQEGYHVTAGAGFYYFEQ